MVEDKIRIQTRWNANPCGTRPLDYTPGSLEYFRQLDTYRYGDYAWWLSRVMEFDRGSSIQAPPANDYFAIRKF